MFPALRSDNSYLEELHRAASQADLAAIVVSYGEETWFVWNAGHDPANKLRSLIASGGRPMATLAAKIVGNAFFYCLDPFPEYEDSPGIHAYLKAVGEQVANAFEKRWQVSRN